MRGLIGQGYMRIILVCPTGGGKTVIAAHIIDLSLLLGKRILVCAHRIELINQTARQLARFGVTDIGVIRANDERVNPDAHVQVASIDTLRNREKPAADIVFIDECHRSMSDTYRALFPLYHDSLFIGLTATPFRIDNQGLGELYQALVTCAKPSQLIADGFIVEPKIYSTPYQPNLSDVELSFGNSDFHNSQLASVMMKPKLMGSIVEEWKKHAGGRRTICFAVNVEHSKEICEVFRREGVAAAHIDSETPLHERNKALLELESGKLLVICNVDVLSEGWDQPSVKCAMLLRPTQSLRLHLQQCGRILRPWDVKNDVIQGLDDGAVIIDHAGNCWRHGLPQWDRTFDLATGQHKKEDAPNLRVCDACYTMWSGASRICPVCGAEKVQEEKKPINHDTQTVLKEFDSKKVISQEDVERQFFIKRLEACRNQGMRPGAASYKFKEKYGKWPPYAWKRQADGLLASDPAWKEAIENRQKTSQFWKERNNAKADIQETTEQEGTGPDAGYTQEPEEDYFGQFKVTDDEIPF